MNKAIFIGLMLGATSVAAYSQSNVQIFGRFNTSVAHVSGPTAKTMIFDSAGATSNFGLKGQEDLGGGLYALFRLEAKLSTDTGDAGAALNSGLDTTVGKGLWSRSSWVGLKGNFGEVHLGRDYSAGMGGVYPIFASPIGINVGGSAIAPMGLGLDFWNNNMVKYMSPEFANFNAVVGYMFGERPSGSPGKGGGYSGYVEYFNKGIDLRFRVGGQKDRDISSDKSVNFQYFDFRYNWEGNYALVGGMIRVHAPGGKILSWVDSKVWTFGGNYKPLPKTTFSAQYFKLFDKRANGTASEQLALSALYDLSKRTTLFAILNKNNNGSLPVQSLYTYSADVPNVNTTGVAIGVQHTF